MNQYDNEILKDEIPDEEIIDFDALEEELEHGLEDSLSELEFLEKDKEKISNPDNLGNAVMDVVWDQFVIQIGAVAGEDFIKENRGLRLDLRDEAHIQTTENFANGIIASHNTEIDYQQRYDDWQSNFVKDENGNVVMHETRVIKTDSKGNIIKGKDGKPVKKKVETLVDGYRKPYDKKRDELGLKGNKEKGTAMDETVSVAEIVRDPAANAHMTEDERIAFDVSEKNLNEIDSKWNSSKGDTPTNEWLDNPNSNGQKPREIFDNLDEHSEEQLRKKDAEAREEYEKQKKEGEERSIVAGKRSQKAEAFRIGKKALRAAIMGLLAELVRNIISKLVLWLKSKEKSLKTFLNQVKEAISKFIRNIKQNLITAGTTIASTALTAIFGPIKNTIQTIWTMIKQGGKTVKEAIDYVKSVENKNKPFGELMLEVGKIVITGLTAMGALVLGEVIEKGLLTIPVFAVEIPLLGSLASIIGIFMGAVVAGIAGALILNLIDGMIAKKQKREITSRQIKQGNEVLKKERELVNINKVKLDIMKEKKKDDIQDRHNKAGNEIKSALESISDNINNDPFEDLLGGL